MRRTAAALLATLALAAPAHGAASLPDIEDEVMCPTCGTALSVAGGPAAEQQRELIRGYIRAGLDKEQIKARLVAEYGEEVLAEPAGSGFDLLVWLVPAGLAAAGLAGVVIVSRRWRRDSAARGDALPTAPRLSAEDDERLDAELAKLER